MRLHDEATAEQPAPGRRRGLIEIRAREYLAAARRLGATDTEALATLRQLVDGSDAP